MLTPAAPYRDRVLLAAACWAVRRLRARGPLPTKLLVDAGLVRLVDGDAYLETQGGWTALPGVAAAPPPRVDMWRRAPFWSKEPAPPAPTSWFRVR